VLGVAGLVLAVCRLEALPSDAEIKADLGAIYRTEAARPVAAHRGPIMRAMEPLMIQQARALVAELQPWAADSAAASLPLRKGKASGEHGIRPDAHTAKGLAILVRLAPDDVFRPDFTRDQARTHALAILRYLVRTHDAVSGVCADGKPWRDQWQSAHWAALAGEACWLLWDELSPAERWLAARMVCDEADRFRGQPPPSQVESNTRGEENAWNSQIISLAYNMFPGHPHHRQWKDDAIRWILSSFAAQRDLSSDEVIDRRPMRVWLQGLGPNIHEDLTLENHGRVHPDYMACTYLLTSQVPMYVWGGNRVPEAIGHNVAAIARVLQGLATPEGSVVYLNGQDWGLHRNDVWFEFHAAIAVLNGDAVSAALMRRSLETLRLMAARNPRADIYLPEETVLPSDSHILLEYLAHTYVLMAERGEGPDPLPDAQLWRGFAGSRLFGTGRFGVVRTAKTVSTFSWGAQVMGLVLPLGADLLLSPEPRGLIGHVAVEGQPRDVPEVRRIVVAPLAEGLGVTGVLGRCGGAVEQRFGFLALPDGRAVYADLVTPGREAGISGLDLGTLGVLNDGHWPLHDGSRTVYFAGGRARFDAAKADADAPVEFPSPWLNLDRRLGIVRLAASGPAVYTPKPTGAAGRLEQRFDLNAVPGAALRGARPGRPVAHGVFVFYPGQTEEQTAATAARCRLLSVPGEALVRLGLEDGWVIEFDLDALRLRVIPAVPAAASAAEVTALAARVARYHLADPRARRDGGWGSAVLCSGVLALGDPELDEKVAGVCRELQWRPGNRVYHADYHAIGQSYLALFARRHDPAMIAPLRERFDYILAHPIAGQEGNANELVPDTEWSWCDALFMAPPAWAGLARATGDRAYLDFALAGWWKTTGMLFDRERRLFFRDRRMTTLHEPNGAKVFWCRGNGWVIAGLARLLEQMPAGHPDAPRLRTLFSELACALADLQQSDGLWRSSLLDPASYPVAEASGSGLIDYALAWGINHGVLDRATYLPGVWRAWRGLSACVTPEGRVTHAQPAAGGPANFDPSSSEDFGAGAFLLASSEMARLASVQGSSSPDVHESLPPPR